MSGKPLMLLAVRAMKDNKEWLGLKFIFISQLVDLDAFKNPLNHWPGEFRIYTTQFLCDLSIFFFEIIDLEFDRKECFPR